MNQKIEVGSVVKVYKGTPCALQGGIVKVLDKDSSTGDLLVGEDLDNTMWVTTDNVEVVSFERPNDKEKWLRDLGWFIVGATTCLVTVIIKVNLHG